MFGFPPSDTLRGQGYAHDLDFTFKWESFDHCHKLSLIVYLH